MVPIICDSNKGQELKYQSIVNSKRGKANVSDN